MKILRSTLLAAGIILLATATRAQETSLKVDVPFDFVAGDHAYPAGEYTLKSFANNDAIIHIDGYPELPSRILVSNGCTVNHPSKQTKLVFRRVGENYFLYQIWVAGNSDGREFPKGRAEVQLAQNRENQQMVMVAAVITK